MSGIAGTFVSAPRPGLGQHLAPLLAAMPHRGDGEPGVLETGHGAIGVRRLAWEVPALLAGPAAVACHEEIAVVADASIYYRTELKRGLRSRGVACASEAPSDLILAAYRVWGPECVLHLEGDFAFIVLDGRSRSVLLARDHVGRRPLHYAVRDGTLVVASTARAVAAHPGVRAELHLPAVAAALAGLLGGSTDTGFDRVHPVPAGTGCRWTPGNGVVQIAARWTPPAFAIGGQARLRDGAQALRELLVTAVRERAAPVTAVWLSGGADSTAVFGAGQQAAADMHGSFSLLPVTVSYPVGDSARENDHVEAIARQWSTAVTWIDSEGVPLLDDALVRAAVRDDPYAHVFEPMNRRLAQTSAGLGARIAFDGYGGDQLFHVSEAYLADLFARFRWGELARAMRAFDYRGPRAIVKHCVVPWLPESTWRGIQRLRGKHPDELLAQSLPKWLTPDWGQRAALRARAALEPPRRLFESPSAYESRWYAETPYFPRAVSWAGAIALEGGVDVRSPLMDRRIIEFAASRPLAERVAPGETKVLLREAVKGLIPESVRAPRPTKTGVPKGYLHRRLAVELAPAIERVFAGDRSLLADLGIVDLAAFRAGLARYARTPEHVPGIQLLLTLQCELWLRSVSAKQ